MLITVWTTTSFISCSGCSKAFELLIIVLKDNGKEPSFVYTNIYVVIVDYYLGGNTLYTSV